MLVRTTNVLLNKPHKQKQQELELPTAAKAVLACFNFKISKFSKSVCIVTKAMILGSK